MTHDGPAYGLWSLALLNAAIFIMFAFSFTKPQSLRDWRSFGAYSAFIMALFAEMYGFPLTIYLLSGWIQTRFPKLDLLTHDAGHLWSTLFGWQGDPHFSPAHILSNVLIAAGFILIAAAWPVLHAAQQKGELATTGPYARIRHPQYVGFIAILTGFVLQWPTLLTLLMYPPLLVMYVVLAKREEREAQAQFGAAYDRYAEVVHAWLPQFGRPVHRA